MTNEAASTLWPLSNPLATVEQLRISASQLDGVPPDLERALRFHAARLTQAAGLLLRIPQTTVAEAVVVLTRFFTGPEGGSFALHSIKDISAACLYLTAKTSLTPLSPRSVLNVYACLTHPALSPLAHPALSPLAHPAAAPAVAPPDPTAYTLSEGQYQAAQQTLYAHEALVRRTLGHATRAVLPHPLALVYLQTFGLARGPRAADLARRALARLNDALLSPQRLYLTHAPHALAVAAVYRAARDVGVRLADGAWWSVCDVDREELGFLVVALGSLEGWVREEGRSGAALWTTEAVRRELDAAEKGDGTSEEI